MRRHYDHGMCIRKAEQHWEMSHLARRDGDRADEAYHQELARVWELRARDGGYTEGVDQ